MQRGRGRGGRGGQPRQSYGRPQPHPYAPAPPRQSPLALEKERVDRDDTMSTEPDLPKRQTVPFMETPPVPLRRHMTEPESPLAPPKLVRQDGMYRETPIKKTDPYLVGKTWAWDKDGQRKLTPEEMKARFGFDPTKDRLQTSGPDFKMDFGTPKRKEMPPPPKSTKKTVTRKMFEEGFQAAFTGSKAWIHNEFKKELVKTMQEKYDFKADDWKPILDLWGRYNIALAELYLTKTLEILSLKQGMKLEIDLPVTTPEPKKEEEKTKTQKTETSSLPFLS